jgi:hypothetical protein
MRWYAILNGSIAIGRFFNTWGMSGYPLGLCGFTGATVCRRPLMPLSASAIWPTARLPLHIRTPYWIDPHDPFKKININKSGDDINGTKTLQ